MSNVISMFRTDEITGLKVPNRKIKKEFHIVNVDGKSLAIAFTWNEAVKRLFQLKGREIVIF